MKHLLFHTTCIRRYALCIGVVLGALPGSVWGQTPACTVSAGNDTVLCAPGTVQLSATPGFDTYVWSPAEGLSDPNIATPVATVTGTATVTYTVTATVAGSGNLVTNGDFAEGNVGFACGYLFSAEQWPCDYSVGPDYFTAGWGIADHSSDTGNMFMSIDCCWNTTLLWQQTITGLQPNTDYTFSFWATRAVGNLPIFDVHFIGDVTGDLLGASLPGVEPYDSMGQWDEYTVTWNSGDNTSVSLAVYTEAAELYGDDFAVDDFAFTAPLTCIATDTITLTVQSVAPPVLPPDMSVCRHNPLLALDATGQNVLWYGTGSGGVGTATAPVPSTDSVGTTTYYATQTVGGCESELDSTAITVVPTPGPPVLPADTSVCRYSVLPALTATGQLVLWYTGTFGGAPQGEAPVPSTASVGTTVYYAIQIEGGCVSMPDSTVVTVLPAPGPPVLPADTSVCRYTLLPALAATGQNVLWYATLPGAAGTVSAPIPGTNAVGTVTYYATQTLGGCESAADSVSVTVLPAPLPPVLPADTSVCRYAALPALTATGQNLLWYTGSLAGPGSTVVPVPSTSAVGTITYYATQTLGGCTSTPDSVAITVSPVPLPPVLPADASVCRYTVLPAFVATGQNLLWYTGSLAGPGSTVAPVPATDAVGTVTYYATQTPGGCTGAADSVAVTVLALPAPPPILAYTSACQHAVLPALMATGQNIVWYSPPAGGPGSSVAPVPATGMAGTFTYYATQTVGGCTSGRDSAVITVLPVPLPPALPADTSVCRYTVLPALAATGQNLLWHTASLAGPGSAVAPVPGTDAVGTVTYYATQTVNGCPSGSDSVAVTVLAVPLPPGMPADTSVCQYAVLPALAATGQNILWYSPPAGGPGNATAPVPATNAAGTFIYYATQAPGACGSAADSVAVTVLPLPLPPGMPADTSVCRYTVLPALAATGQNLLWYTAPLGGPGSATSPVPATDAVGTFTYYATQTLGGCTGAPASVTVTVGNDVPYFELGNTLSPCMGDAAKLGSEDLGTDWRYVWMDSVESTPREIFYPSPELYILTATGACGRYTDSVRVLWQDCYCSFYWPNTFTPNGDVHNETFRPVYQCKIDEYCLRIYDRWGELIFESHNPDEGWNGQYCGRPVQQDLYVVQLIYSATNGSKRVQRSVIDRVTVLK